MRAAQAACAAIEETRRSAHRDVKLAKKHLTEVRAHTPLSEIKAAVAAAEEALEKAEERLWTASYDSRTDEKMAEALMAAYWRHMKGEDT